MKINPKKMSWEAPTTNVDGTEITYELEYEVGLVTDTGSVDPLMVVPSQLVEDGKYEAPIAELGLDPGGYEIVMRSFAKENPSRVSVWSESVEFFISDEIPNPPLVLTVF